MREERIFGPPGTGKTQYLARQVENAVEKHGVDNIIVASFTKTAALEIISRSPAIPRENAGTLHALCFRAMGQPEIAETRTDDFNKSQGRYQLSGDSKTNQLDEMGVDAQFQTEADELMAEYKFNRALMIHPQKYRKPVYEFMMEWEKWKSRNNLVDFSDMIQFTIARNLGPPGGQTVGFYDEAQDFNLAELTLVRRWAQDQEVVLLAGDDDQCLYGFTGATPDAFLKPEIPPEQKRVLKQSWRVPRAVHAIAQAWIEQNHNREPKVYQPRAEEGEVRDFYKGNYKAPQYIIDDAEKYIAAGKTVMFLTSCGYMLNAVKAVLRERGIAFHNPYRKTRGDWNPLGTGGKNRTTSRDRLCAFLGVVDWHDYWEWEQLKKWVDICKAKGMLQKHGKEIVDNQVEFCTAYKIAEIRDMYAQIFEPGALEEAIRRSPEWFKKRLLASKQNVLEFPIRIYEKGGLEALNARPQVIISTIHGVKGGEADVVYLFPDVSLAAMREWQEGGDRKESVVRTFYVGMTRSRESLIFCPPASRLQVRIH
jgi:DNA helicase-2/ATP-dependent DNA helicase PcrA